MFTPVSLLTAKDYIPYSTEGLVALYNTNASGGYSGNTIYDLSGNSNNLIMTGSYSAGTGSNAGSIYFASGSTARTAGDLSASLHGTGSEMTIIYYSKWDRQGINFTDPSWFIGNFDTGADGKQIYDQGANLNINLGYRIGNSGTPVLNNTAIGLYEMTGSIKSTSPSYYWTPVQQYVGINDLFWSVLGVTKANQTLSYTVPDSNIEMYALNYAVSNISSNALVSGSLLSSNKGYIFPSGYESLGGFIYGDVGGNVLSTDLTNSILQINPSGYAFTIDYGGGTYGYRQQWFGGMAIYDRVLSSREILNIMTYFNQTRLTK